MSSRQQLILVKEQAEKELRKLSENFSRASLYVENERQQLQQLQGYETEYLQKIQQQQHRWTAANSQRYRHFCLELSKTIKAQQDKVSLADQQLDGMRQSLFQQQQRIKVLTDLIERQQRQVEKVQNQQLQKEMDDLSARQYFK